MYIYIVFFSRSIFTNFTVESLPGVLTVRLTHIKALDIGGVPSQLVTKQFRVVVQVPLLETQPKAIVDLVRYDKF